jgi:hypothetical protein
MYGLMTEASERNRYDQATAHLDPPFAVVDLAAFDSNALDMVRRSGGLPIRVVSKSLRCRPLIERALARPGYRGIMCYSLAEAGSALGKRPVGVTVPYGDFLYQIDTKRHTDLEHNTTWRSTR